MIRFEFAAGPAISILKMNSKQIVYFIRLAIFDSRLAAILFKLERDNGIRWYKFFEFETCTGCRNVFQDRPLIAGGAGFGFPLNFNKISAKLSVFLTFWSHD